MFLTGLSQNSWANMMGGWRAVLRGRLEKRSRSMSEANKILEGRSSGINRLATLSARRGLPGG
jgi:hypothetical protein